jgi:hypothetical protein
MEKRQSLQQMLLGEVVVHLQETETKSMFITLYLYQIKMGQGPQYQTQTLKLVQEGA